ncbi:hypothetical protein [Gemmatimonas groenlandica]|uniref:Periplasmic heavy metal sensor n=1 Tax=Gemmatimonas groenlandica TaxID=2732249 RepID=A0A6M4INH2_9BACT|nr:hypothetical protein [Gemmatimonas groenlandica]QJR36263.1 hypothetical protein HKW67_12490 [Gemmatimonas groenlandica]
MSTSRPKSLAMMFILGAFLTGGAVGFAADRMVSPPRPDVFNERTMVDELARELKLSSAQRVVIDSVWDWRRKQSREIMKTVRPTLDAVRDSARVLMMNTLDDAQKTAFRALLERNQRTADSAARARGETK